MWSVAHLCRCTSSLRAARTRLLVPATRSGFSISNAVSRKLASVAKYNNCQGLRLRNLLRSKGLVVRLCSSAPKPKNTKLVGYWLLGCSGMVFTAVVLGGVTRLTESGLSMVTWRLLGERLPRSAAEWEREFALYQQYPEFRYKNRQMTLAEFKWIWYMEFAHRTWGRCIGAAVFLPAAWFWARGFLDRGMKLRVAACSALVAAQGLMGWYMVQSGLEERFAGPADVPRVSQYRLAAHLTLALVLHATLLGGALRVLRVPPGAARAPPALRALSALAHSVKAMAFLTAVSGAFVAGLDAGLVYNSFPKMGDRWLPDDILALRPTPRNFTENPTTVQFDHRVLGGATLCAASALWLTARRRALPRAARGALHALAGAAWLQAALGALTLLQYVPTPLAAAHQAGSLALLSLAVWLSHELRLLKYIPK